MNIYYEVKNVLNNQNYNPAPCSDGFTALFFKIYWPGGGGEAPQTNSMCRFVKGSVHIADLC